MSLIKRIMDWFNPKEENKVVPKIKKSPVTTRPKPVQRKSIVNKNNNLRLVKEVISNDKELIELNKLRRRNFLLIKGNVDLIYDVDSGKINFKPNVRFSEFEHDTNRKYLEGVIFDFLYNFKNKQQSYLNLLNENSRLYRKQIEIINGNEIPNDDELLILISLLGRLKQQSVLGPIIVNKNEKLEPRLIERYQNSFDYIKEIINTYQEFEKLIVSNGKINLLSSNNFGVRVNGTTNNLMLGYKKDFKPVKVEKEKLFKGNYMSPNYLYAFFKKIVELPRFKDIKVIYNSEEEFDVLIDYRKRFLGQPQNSDFQVVYKMRSILQQNTKEILIESVEDIYYQVRDTTYSYVVSSKIIEQHESMRFDALTRLYFIYEQHVKDEIELHLNKQSIRKENHLKSRYNDSYISIASDMHFNRLDIYNKGNF